jgi:DNA-binding SARP family transcriptional activator
MLGPVRAEGPSGTVQVTAPRELALFAELLVHAGRPVTREHLADTVWGDGSVLHPAHAVHTLVSRLRRRLAGAAASPSEATITTGGACYVLTVGEDAVDALRFGQLVASARRAAGGGDTTTGADLYTRALALWRGRALSGVPVGSPCVAAERMRLDELRISAVEERGVLQLRLGGHAALAAELIPVVGTYPLRERLRAVLMLALYRSGRIAEALQTYRDASTYLVEQLGIDPGPELRRLHERMLNADARLAAEDLGPPAGTAFTGCPGRQAPVRQAPGGPVPGRPEAPDPASEDLRTISRLVGDLQASSARLEARVRELEAAVAARPPP